MNLPGYAADVRANLDSVLTGSPLTPAQVWGAALACAVAARSPHLLRWVAAEAGTRLPAPVLEQAKAAAVTMAMNNVFYRAQHLTGRSAPARLRMRAIASPTLRAAGVARAEFELWCLAVSAVFGCEVCLRHHDQALRGLGVPDGEIHEALRIAGVVHAAAVTLDAEAALG